MELFALVIDADARERGVVRLILQEHNWNVCEAESVDAALCFARERPSWGIIFCDADLSTQSVNHPNGLTLLSELKRQYGEASLIVITAAAGRPITALDAILNGASEYLRKPLEEEKIVACSHIVLKRLLAVERDKLYRSRATASEFTPIAPEFVGGTEAIIKVFKDLAQIVRGIRLDDVYRRKNTSGPDPQTSVFITGETGTGKELIAQLIHERSSHADGHFVPVNCSNLSPDLAESELFGHMKGAFTGATKEKEGLWEVASGGTIFLDEITEAPPSVLPKLLRVLQDGRVKRLGSNQWKQTHVQIIAASNRDMPREVSAGRFRADLYHRLSLHKLHVPPLRERLGDIPVIVEHLVRRHFTRQVRFSQEALDVLMTYGFPGNVRELENIVRGAARRAPDGVVYVSDLAAYVEMIKDHDVGHRAELIELASAEETSLTDPPYPSHAGLEERVHQFKLQLVNDALAKCNNNVAQTARYLKISRPSLYKLLREIDRETSSLYHLNLESLPARGRSASASNI